MLSFSFRYRFEAAHRFLESPSLPCQTPHGHSWHATLGLEFRGSHLDKNAMATPFEEVKKDWKKLLSDTLDHSFFHHWQDPLADSILKVHPEARLLPFPGDPTTELIGLLLFSKMDTIFGKIGLEKSMKVSSIKVEETPSNCVTLSSDFYQKSKESFSNFNGWWNNTELNSRSCAQNL